MNTASQEKRIVLSLLWDWYHMIAVILMHGVLLFRERWFDVQSLFFAWMDDLFMVVVLPCCYICLCCRLFSCYKDRKTAFPRAAILHIALTIVIEMISWQIKDIFRALLVFPMLYAYTFASLSLWITLWVVTKQTERIHR